MPSTAVSFKPAGCQQVIPYLIIPDPQKTIEFVKKFKPTESYSDSAHEETLDAKPAKPDGRSLRWQKMTPEQRAIQVAAMKAGKAKPSSTQPT